MTSQEDDWIEKERLHLAVQDGNLDDVKKWLQSGRDPNQFDETGFTPLMYAAKNEHLEIMKVLLENGADVDAYDEKNAGDTALGDVAGNCSFEVAKVLVDAGANPTIPGWMHITALHRAKDRKRGDGPKIYKLLLDAAKRFS